MNLNYTLSGYIYISPEDDCREVVDAMLATNYSEEFCLAMDFSPEFVSRLMKAGFLVMSMNIIENGENFGYVLLPKLHLTRSALFYSNLHVKKSIKRFMNRYDLKFDVEFDRIISRCVEKHGSDWLTPPLVESIRTIRSLSKKPQNPSYNPDQTKDSTPPPTPHSSLHITNSTLQTPLSSLLTPNSTLLTPNPYPASFALYRDGELAAGEFGVICGKVYTSYSGFYEEDNAGTVQIIKTTRYLQKNGFSFFDMGMPLDYKSNLGAVDISPEQFVELFRA